MSDPILRNVEKVKPPYPIGKFPKQTIVSIGASIVYQLHTRNEARLEGNDWESIFANAIKAEWKPSNVGLDDVRLGNCCWGAKTVKNPKPSTATKVRLISGRNSLDYSYNESNVRKMPPDEIGPLVLGIWNERVSSVRQRFAHCRTVVLIKSNDLSENAVFEFETVRFEPDRFTWLWNKRANLEGFDANGEHRFTWQPHGAQFTVIEEVPADRVAFGLRMPGALPPEATLKALGFTEDWVTIL